LVFVKVAVFLSLALRLRLKRPKQAAENGKVPEWGPNKLSLRPMLAAEIGQAQALLRRAYGPESSISAPEFDHSFCWRPR